MKTFLGLPIFGVILPFIGYRKLPLNQDGSFVDTGEADLLDEEGYYFVKPFVVEWLSFGFSLRGSPIYLSATGEVVSDPPFDVVG